MGRFCSIFTMNRIQSPSVQPPVICVCVLVCSCVFLCVLVCSCVCVLWMFNDRLKLTRCGSVLAKGVLPLKGCQVEILDHKRPEQQQQQQQQLRQGFAFKVIDKH